VHKSGGKFPSWQDNMVFNIIQDQSFTFEVWDKDTISSDDLVGAGELNFAEAL
jgi:hypothetical protein